jgi:hypothetical protein
MKLGCQPRSNHRLLINRLRNAAQTKRVTADE